MGFFVLTHEAGHNTLFKSKWLNDFVYKWLTAPMDFFNGKAYMLSTWSIIVRLGMLMIQIS
ncbi:MAG: hypothetical protein CM1200mP40_17880 [Gammaproteobacteria bacterium]|nr:MAG: hypothetical protein CM1200mP40_17880 [Gammaproteobacteria bacterium]